MWEQIGDPRCDIPSNRPDADNRGISPPNTSRVQARSERTDPNGDSHNAGWLPTVGWLGQIGQDNAQAGPGPTTIVNKMKHLADQPTNPIVGTLNRGRSLHSHTQHTIENHFTPRSQSRTSQRNSNA